MNNKCSKCNNDFILDDLKSSYWVKDHEEIIFECSHCGHKDITKIPLFDSGHIDIKYLGILEKDSNNLPKDLLNKLYRHVSSCEVCKNLFDEKQLNEAKENVEFHEKSLEFFVKESNSKTVLKKLNIDEVTITEDKNGKHINRFTYNDKNYYLKIEDEFFEKSYDDDAKVLYYYINNEVGSVGMASFIFQHNDIILENIWFMSNKIQDYFSDLKKGKVKLTLENLENIFNYLNSEH